jgi:AmiR/NasT family two-component response regulator
MTVCWSVERPTFPTRQFDPPAELHRLVVRVRSAEEKAANLERALESNRRIGIAIGILMCQRQLTADQAIEILKTHSQHRNIKLRELAETVIYTGAL